MRAHKGQSTVEYILLVTAVIAGYHFVYTGHGNKQPFSRRMNSVFNSTTQDMLNVAFPPCKTTRQCNKL